MDALAGLLSLPQESDGKEAERQLRLQVALARSEAENLVHDYVSFLAVVVFVLREVSHCFWGLEKN